MTRQVSIAFQTNKTASEYIELAKLVDQYAFDTISVYCDAPFHPSYGPLLLMAPHITRACLGPAAVSPSRIHPIDIAANTALLSDLSKGGVYIGLARGAWLKEYGVPENKKPLQTIREAIDVIHILLSGAEGGYQGQVYSLAPHVRTPYPLPEKDIPILIGTWGQKLATIAGEIADEVKIGGSANPDFVPIMRQYIHTGEMIGGRNPGSVGLVIGAVCVIDEDRQVARLVAKHAVALYLPVVALLDSTLSVEPELLDRVKQSVESGEIETAAGLISDELLQKFAFAGNPADLVQQVEGLFDAGVDRVEFGTPHGLKSSDGIRLLGERVLPALLK